MVVPESYVGDYRCDVIMNMSVTHYNAKVYDSIIERLNVIKDKDHIFECAVIYRHGSALVLILYKNDPNISNEAWEEYINDIFSEKLNAIKLDNLVFMVDCYLSFYNANTYRYRGVNI